MQKTTLDEYFDLLTTTHSTNLVREFLHEHHEVLMQNPLRYAVFANRKDIVELLLELHVDINGTDLQGRNALHYAVSNRRTKIVEILIAHKALHNPDNQNKTPLDLALMDPEYLMLPTLLEDYSAELSLDQIVKIIRNNEMPVKIRHAAYLYLVAKGPVALLREFAIYMNFNYTDSKGNDAVLVACQTGNIDALIWLCKAKAQPLTLKVRNTAGDYPVLIATAHGQRDLLMDCLVQPVSSGGCGLQIHVKNTATTYYDTVQTAIANGQVTLLKELEHVIKFSIKQYDDHYFSPVPLAIKGGHKEMLALLIKPVRKGGYGLSLNSVGNPQHGSNAIECAIFYKQKELLRELVRPKSQGGFGCSFNVRDVLAFAINKPEMLLELIRPVAQGGHGLDFNVYAKHPADRGLENLKLERITTLVNAGERELLTDYIAAVYPDKKSIQIAAYIANAVITQGHIEILDDLVRPIAQGGFGLILDSNAILSAILHNKCNILLKLMKPIKDGGFGVTIDVETVIQRVMSNNTDFPLDAFFQFLIDHFNKLHLENGIDTAIKWVKNTPIYTAQSFQGYPDFPHKALRERRSIEFKKALANHYKELIPLCFQNGKKMDVHNIVNTLEEISPDEGQFFKGEIFNREGHFLAAFEYYLKAFQIKDSAIHDRIGCALANLILSGKVVLGDAQRPNLNWDLDLAFMQYQAITAYQYLHGGVSESSVELRNCLDQILAGNLCNPYDIGKAVTWQHEALIKYNEYYSEKAPALLHEPACRKSQAHANQVLRELMSAQSGKQESSPAKYSPRFVMPADKHTPNDNNRSASKGF